MVAIEITRGHYSTLREPTFIVVGVSDAVVERERKARP